MLLAGLEVPVRLVVELAQCLRMAGVNDPAETLEDAYADERGTVALTISDREAILRALDIARTGSRNFKASCSSSTNGDRRKGS